MRLYVLPGACSLASHIALETVAEVVPEGSRPWEVAVLERGHNYDPDYTAINPIGTVPALCDHEVSAVHRCVLYAPSTIGCANSVRPVLALPSLRTSRSPGPEGSESGGWEKAWRFSPIHHSKRVRSVRSSLRWR